MQVFILGLLIFSLIFILDRIYEFLDYNKMGLLIEMTVLTITITGILGICFKLF